jgi:predicted nucleotidyltransferase
MSVNSYLVELSSSLVLTQAEQSKISTSITNMNSKLKSYFQREIVDQFKFGSMTRGTILPRKADEGSDVDYMIVFNSSSEKLKPQTYLNKLKSFVESSYSSSEVHQSTPTIILELTHIKFDLVPALNLLGPAYQIPSPAASWQDWVYTNPTESNNKLTSANQYNNNQIKPLVRLVKYWNALNGKHFGSFSLEEFICSLAFLGCVSIKDYFFRYWESFSCNHSTPQHIKDKVQRSKTRVQKIKDLESSGQPLAAENEIIAMLPRL